MAGKSLNFFGEDIDENIDLPRSSTPYSDDSHHTSINQWTYEGIAYEMFLNNLQGPRKKYFRRGLKGGIHPSIRTCHLVKFRKKSKDIIPETSFDLTINGASDITRRLFQVQKAMRTAYYKLFGNNSRCKVKSCPVICDCRLNDSLLNRRIPIESDDDEEDVAGTSVIV